MRVTLTARAFWTSDRASTSYPPLADFGLASLKARAPTSTEQKAVTAAKRIATRKARGTMGKNQKVVAGRCDLAPVALYVVA